LIYLIANSNTTALFFQGVVQVEKLKTPEDFIPAVLERVKKEYLSRVYRLNDWKDANDLLDQIARRTGRLLNVPARMVWNYEQRLQQRQRKAIRPEWPFFVTLVNLDAANKCWRNLSRC
jgi:nuclear GTP-binding protein